MMLGMVFTENMKDCIERADEALNNALKAVENGRLFDITDITIVRDNLEELIILLEKCKFISIDEKVLEQIKTRRNELNKVIFKCMEAKLTQMNDKLVKAHIEIEDIINDADDN